MTGLREEKIEETREGTADAGKIRSKDDEGEPHS